MTLFDEAEDCLALSHLIFLFTDLRLLSATGRINTRFETLCIDSDDAPKTTAEELAGLEELDEEHETKGISAAQLTAILMVELRREVLRQRDAKKRNRGIDDDSSILSSLRDSGKSYEGDMHVMLRSYNDNIGEDLVTNIPKYRTPVTKVRNMYLKSVYNINGKSLSQANLASDGDRDGDCDGHLDSIIEEQTKDPKKLKIRNMYHLTGKAEENFNSDDVEQAAAEYQTKDHPSMEEQTMPEPQATTNGASAAEDTKKSALKNSDQPTITFARFKPPDKKYSELKFDVDDSDDDSSRTSTEHNERSKFQTQKLHILNAAKSRRLSIVNKVEENITQQGIAIKKIEEVGDAFFNMSVRPSQKCPDDSNGVFRSLTETELLDRMEEAVQSRVDGKLDFMFDFFKEGSLTQTMIKCKSKFVWLNDWHPLKELTYAISINKEEKKIMVLFRGAITKADWGHAFDAKLKKIPNPILPTFTDKHSSIKISNGFYRYLFRKRKDTGTNKYIEITSKLYEYAKRIGDDYKVVITGLSLGGALSTIFGFFAATDERFTRYEPLQIITFGSPYVGSYSFADSFRYLEMTDKLRHARFHNVRDWVTHLPFNVKRSKRGARYQHVGVAIKLPRVNHCCCCKLTVPKFEYIHKEPYWASYYRAIKNNWIFHLPRISRAKLVHGLNEHQKRLHHFGSNGGELCPMLFEDLETIYQEIAKTK
mmetsp:Transcript_48894/g.72649  ORF Transcript_48894/g.72649 Transcript_48894/m.72649 type:complete len:707 (+) Transcript_48894:107-2227(+)|eukprot:CAMPEP_0195530248 /NCGR_PEP_ID=MMETSP0794_2-20130614/33086_1 /TAXON_ID=515487 /ORGANISM="Stephanopyxis turris, Strain CCMP 815" /LENGTH=706 /DNA_ID=CAMNT_0040661719 /DNA_START=104 /DNA_END=2224 /DNA_ORIENTATION=-